ncbi:tRNA pseudouridine synthase TruA [Natronomonas pharaonis DSM 2160]|uniref:tRNA pseudouridine synthase A n=1 Tax=Natronomonas pharaonis (strain ATCC 35678 / DSM 2160 / CIP 103997 / JCM 8858 / NBRC 14720 / NCIMB 2260 / Gabara) TaxID=348780 RepID=TRUA_NATPD|nr:tRNA pseudouridine(38-40) synthase TruA [Natronomonas pharaonis]Q3IMP6.1 RecName: Full=tRNA pseudouridine synthase A; AltName: Full=tRNA pseudouridine(38-40) synthase; AltName: Full=tRNA pseudouridylate synthase I; AltName: Full=tRNA-uridine isomerase I [Natronomonas pharaonis DSM 2160]CAI50612.1 tRNA pseudouridine synthase TruA [Natronomonas pharaonis DSM 2160]
MRAFRIAYDGTGFRGFQRQPHGETVENALFEALSSLGVAFEDGRPPGYAAAGRTDAGVSARAQTVAFEAPAWLLPRALNGELPASVRAWAAADVGDAFHATHDATARAYRYFLYAPEPSADTTRARAACARLSGSHDFHNFTPDDRGTERTLSMRLRRQGPFLVVDCRAGGFARQLVRRLVAAVAAVARGERPLSFLGRALDDDPLSGADGIAAAPPEPLLLADVVYPGVEFTVDDRAAESARTVFATRRRQRLADARVAGALSPPE